MSYVAAGVAVAGAATSAYGSMQAGNAASKAAREQQAAAGAWSDQVGRDKKDALAALGTPSAMASYDIALKSQERNVQRMETLAQNMDPALVSAGKQAYDLLQGKSAPVLQNIQNQRSLQRTQMLDSLRQQLGPGAETSSAGMQAIQKFDNDTANMMSQTQQQYLAQVNQIALGGVPLGQALGAANESLDKISLNSPGAQAADMIAKYTGLMSGAQEATVNAAGGEQKGAQLQGQMLGQLGGAMIQGAAMSAGSRVMSPSPTPAPPGGTPPVGPEMSPTGINNPNNVSGMDESGQWAADFAKPNNTLMQAVRPPGAGIPSSYNPNSSLDYGMSGGNDLFRNAGMFNYSGRNYGNVAGGN